ncbi:hypothetical protein MBLNU230_g4098t1 [Neophaeotheca triangularis]
MSNEVTFYDLPSSINGKTTCWSLNPWKTRLALNYKQIPYHTDWTEYPDLEPRFKALGIPANSPTINPNFSYSSPAIRTPSGKFVMDSRLIADELEKLQPLPSLHLDSPAVDRAQEAVAEVLKSLGPVLMPRVPGILPERSAEYFHRTREQRFGMPLAEFERTQGGEGAWDGAGAGFEMLGRLLRERPEGPYALGKEVCYADFVVMGLWVFLRVLGERDLWERVEGMEGGVFESHFEACRGWAERDDR